MSPVFGFDNRAADSGHLLISLRLPAEQLGHQSADRLRERRHGQLGGEPVHCRIAMGLISRREFSFGAENAIAVASRSIIRG